MLCRDPREATQSKYPWKCMFSAWQNNQPLLTAEAEGTHNADWCYTAIKSLRQDASPLIELADLFLGFDPLRGIFCLTPFLLCESAAKVQLPNGIIVKVHIPGILKESLAILQIARTLSLTEENGLCAGKRADLHVCNFASMWVKLTSKKLGLRHLSAQSLKGGDWLHYLKELRTTLEIHTLSWSPSTAPRWVSCSPSAESSKLNLLPAVQQSQVVSLHLWGYWSCHLWWVHHHWF